MKEIDKTKLKIKERLDELKKLEATALCSLLADYLLVVKFIFKN